MRPSRTLNLVRAGYGAVLLVAPAAVARAYTGRKARHNDVLLARILGVRQLVQAAACAGHADRATFEIGAEVDLGHAASTVAAAVLLTTLRRAALIDTGVALGFAAGGALAARAWQPMSAVMPGVIGAVCRSRDRLASAVATVTVPARWRG